MLVKEWLVEKGIPYDAPVKVLQKQFLVDPRQAMSVVKFGKALTAAGVQKRVLRGRTIARAISPGG